jgi:MFS family permease
MIGTGLIGGKSVGMLLAIFSVVFIGLQMPSGRLSDRMGRIYPTIAGLSLGIVSLVSLPSATSTR